MNIVKSVKLRKSHKIDIKYKFNITSMAVWIMKTVGRESDYWGYNIFSRIVLFSRQVFKI